MLCPCFLLPTLLGLRLTPPPAANIAWCRFQHNSLQNIVMSYCTTLPNLTLDTHTSAFLAPSGYCTQQPSTATPCGAGPHAPVAASLTQSWTPPHLWLPSQTSLPRTIQKVFATLAAASELAELNGGTQHQEQNKDDFSLSAQCWAWKWWASRRRSMQENACRYSMKRFIHNPRYT